MTDDTQARAAQVRATLENALGNLSLMRGNVCSLFDGAAERRLQEAVAEDVPTAIAEFDLERGEVVIERAGVRYRVRVDREDGLV